VQNGITKKLVLQDHIGSALKVFYSQLLEEPLPRPLLVLVRDLKVSEHRNGKAGKGRSEQ
jgi:hypothetical protein